MAGRIGFYQLLTTLGVTFTIRFPDLYSDILDLLARAERFDPPSSPVPPSHHVSRPSISTVEAEDMTFTATTTA